MLVPAYHPAAQHLSRIIPRLRDGLLPRDEALRTRSLDLSIWQPERFRKLPSRERPTRGYKERRIVHGRDALMQRKRERRHLDSVATPRRLRAFRLQPAEGRHVRPADPRDQRRRDARGGHGHARKGETGDYGDA